MAKKKANPGAAQGSAKLAANEVPPRPKDKSRRASPAAPPAGSSWFSAHAIREIVENVVVALVLAFLFRTFEAEAFVIPTGSMAPTLMGRHRDVTCAQCGYPYQVNASDEVDPRTNQLTGKHVVAGTCPVCRFTMDVGPGNPQRKSYPSYKGDRILVAKFPYQFGDPKRWDVAVFKYPGGAKTNYIKRIVGLPNETIYIHHGDVFVKRDGQDQVRIAAKPPDKVLAMMQPVYDNDYVQPALVRKGLPLRWGPMVPSERRFTQDGPSSAWQLADDLKSFSTDGTGQGIAWLSYRHRVPSYRQWQALRSGAELPPGSVPAQLITDFTAYNTEQTQSAAFRRDPSEHAAELVGLGEPPDTHQLGLHWVGDLVLECTVETASSSGHVLLALMEGGVSFRAELDVATGQATLRIDGLEGFQPKAVTRFRGPGKHHLRFANVDDQLLLWVDGRVVRFDSPTCYGPLDNGRPQPDDLQPARIGSRGAAVRVSHLRLFRDIYYIAQRGYASGRSNSPATDYDTSPAEFPYSLGFDDAEQKLAEFLSNPAAWDVFLRRRQVEFHLAEDQFLVLGDNSSASKDSRLWELEGRQFYVDRDLLIGKALFIYWPHSWNRTPGLPLLPNGIWFPYFPNFARMQFVR